MKKKKIIFISILIIILAFIISTYIYLNTYYKADKKVEEYLKTNDIVSVTKDNNIYFFDGPGEEVSIIFYPGGKVEDISYAPLLSKLAKEGIDCFLIKMPYNLAILDKNAADQLIYGNYKYKKWYLGGHSLGGVVASMYANDNYNNVSGLVLPASYPNKKIDNNIKMLSIYGTNDGILNLSKYQKNKKYWSNNSKEIIIEGGNHSQFGYYGFQNGDNKSDISREEQQNKTIESIVGFIK